LNLDPARKIRSKFAILYRLRFRLAGRFRKSCH